MMLLSDVNNFLYKHVPKTGGTAISTVLLPYSEYARTQHTGMKDIKRELINGKLQVEITKKGSLDNIKTTILILESDFDDLNKFAFIRNPWAREVSRYFHALNATNHVKHQHATKGFDYWINWVCENDVQLQVNMLCDEEGHLLVDYIGRFENLQNDFDSICDAINLPQQPVPVIEPIKYTTPKDTGNYRSFYSEHTRRLVSKTFIKDIEKFEYEF